MSTTQERLRNLISEQCGIKAGEISLDATLKELGLDSLESVELVMEIEQEFKLEIPDEDSSLLDTTGKMVAYLDARAA